MNERQPVEYQIGEHIQMPKEQFENGEYAKNDWVVSDINDEVVFIVQHWYDKNEKWISSCHTGIFKKDLDYSKR